MCKCCQYCLETCYWHLIEKRFCYDDSIALYEEPEKEEKNNNFFDNMAFYDSVAVIAGRAIVTIDPLPANNEHHNDEERPIVQQPRRLKWDNDNVNGKPFLSLENKSKSVPTIYESNDEEIELKTSSASTLSIDADRKDDHKNEEEPKQEGNNKVMDTLKPANAEVRKKSLHERRMSKSLYLKIEQPKEIPIIRQQSMPKFYLDTPDESNQIAMFSPSTALNPVPQSSNFVYDLYSVVQMERERVQNMSQNQAPVHPREMQRAASRLNLIKEKIKLRRVKSTLGTVTNLPHAHHHM